MKETDALSNIQIIGLALKKAQNELAHLKEPIAIVGMSCRFPGANSIDAFWQVLHEGRCTIREIPKQRWNIEEYYDPNPEIPGKMITPKGGFIDDIDQFDAAFFNISSREALYLDPQQRLLLMQTWNALEHAGINPTSLEHSNTGVFLGIATSDYHHLITKYKSPKDINAYIGTGNAFSTATGRISYTLGLQGPNMAIETACSSSLVAMHEALKSLQRGECSLAITGGVNALLAPDTFINFSKAKMLAPDGYCKTFDARADGYVRGEGCGILILKRLSDAKKDNDRVLAIIKASGINQDGMSVGLTAPNGDAQEQLLRQVLRDSKLKAADIDYVECHGTGTSLGDPIEIDAVGSVYGKERDAHNPLKLGSVKTNIGHLEASAGVSGMIKAILAFEHEELPKHLHFKTLNPNINLNFPAKIITENEPWPRGEKPRYQAISSFGFSGTNAHFILGEPPVALKDSTLILPKQLLFVVSAKTQKSLQDIIQSYIHYLGSTKDSIADICYTAAIGRAHFNYKIALHIESKEELLTKLKDHHYQIVEQESEGDRISASDLETLSTAYLAGKPVDWENYYKPYLPALNKANLPTYCFDTQSFYLDFDSEKEAYWEQLQNWGYVQEWQSIHLNALTKPQSLDKTLLISLNSDRTNEWCINQPQIKHVAIHDPVSMTLAQDRGQPYRLNVLNSDHITALLNQHAFEQVIVLCDAQSEADLDEQSIYLMQMMLVLTQALIQHNPPPSLLIVSENALMIENDALQTHSLYLAPLQGFIKSLQLEQTALQARLIDVESLEDLLTNHSALQTLCALPEQEFMIACRKQHYYVPRVIKHNIPQAETFQATPQDTYLISGGLGEIGQVVASWLIHSGAKHIVLMGRNAPTLLVQDRINQWQKNKVDVQVHLVDVSKMAEVNSLIELIEASPHPLAGIFHCAGISNPRLIKDMNPTEMHDALLAKISGAWNLHQCTQSLPLKHFVLFSSIVSFLGNVGQASYAAANAFLDQLALFRSEHHLPALSINWDAWDIGMWARMHGSLRQNLKPLSIEEGTQLLNTLLQTPYSNIAIIKQDLSTLIQRLGIDIISPFLSQCISTDSLTTENNETNQFSYTLSQLDPITRLQQCSAFVDTTVRNVLSLSESEALALDKSFFDMGLDSLMAIELLESLQKTLGTHYPLKRTLIFDYPNVHALSKYISTLFLEPQTTTTHSQQMKEEPIAIISMGCRFPGNANTPEMLWDNLINGVDGIVPVPASRWDSSLYFSQDINAAGTMYVNEGGFLNDIDRFDAPFFNISPREAECMDPQQRLLLEVAWEALERAGINPQELAHTNTGVFVGASMMDYAVMNNKHSNASQLDAYNGVGGALSAISGRLSYFLGLEGPSMVIDTACSSSLVALHQALKSLRHGECSLALSAGVNMLIAPEINVTLSRAKMLSPDARCKTFDASANGYIRSDGCGVIVLKRLRDALSDGDKVLAVIKGSAVNQDGTSGGLTVPSGKAQANLMNQALNDARLSPEDIDFVEAHGTGTKLGDPIEMEAIGEVYGAAHSAEKPLIVGALKSNIGHLESASGIAGVIKTVLALQHQLIPANLHFKQLNPQINANALHLSVASQTIPWKKGDQLRRAGVSSFGFTGTNAHVILEEAPLIEPPPTKDAETHYLFTLSAKSAVALQELISNYKEFLTQTQEHIANICYTTNIGRAHEKYRIAVIAKNSMELQDCLATGRYLQSDELTPLNDATLNPDLDSRLMELAKKYTQGATIDFKAIHDGSILQKAILPTYPFQRQSYWSFVLPEQKIDANKEKPPRNELSWSALAVLIKQSLSSEKKQLIVYYLALLMNKITGLSLETFSPEIAIQNLGLDSLMLMQLRSHIHEDLDVELPFAEIQNASSFSELSDLIADSFSAPDNKASVYDNRDSVILKKSNTTLYQLFVLSPLGFGGRAYSKWPEQLNDSIEVIYLGYEFKGSWSEMIEALAIQLTTFRNKPFMIYGHSMGGMIAYELGLYLERHNLPRPQELIISSVVPPLLFGRISYTYPFNQIDETTSKEALVDLLIEAQYLPPDTMGIKTLSPDDIHNDVLALKAYAFDPNAHLSIPIVALQANNDVLLRDASLISAWSRYTTGGFSYHEVEGTHLFFMNPSLEVFTTIEHVFKEANTYSPFALQVYQLKQFTQGTAQNNTSPFGLDPDGYIVYEPSTHSMAVHLWHDNAHKALNADHDKEDEKIIEYMISHLAYCGRFSINAGIVHHDIHSASIPNYTDDVLSRHYHTQNEKLTLSTLPKTQRKQRNELFQRLVWESTDNQTQSPSLTGSWDIVNYYENDQEVLGQNPRGKMIITESSYFSIQIAHNERKEFDDTNPYLASNEELLSAFYSYRSLFGSCETQSKDMLKGTVLSPIDCDPTILISYAMINETLQIIYLLTKKNNEKIEVKSLWRNST